MKPVIKPRKAVRAMAPYAPPTGSRIEKLRLDFNENTLGCSPRVIKFLKESLTPERLSVYPAYDTVKQTLATHFHVDPAQFILTNGTDEAIQVFINTYIDDNDEVLLLRPSYAMYRFYAELAGARIIEVDYPAPRFEFPLQQLLAAITPRTRAVIVSNPNNPTGTGIDLDGVARILKRARRAAVLVDEAYFEFSGTTALPWIAENPNLFVSRTFSKVYGMAAMRIGCLFSQEANVAYLHKAQSPYSVNTLAALAANEAVRDTAFVQKYVAEVLAARELLCVGLERLGIPYVPSAGNFVLALAGKRALEIRDTLRDRAILVRDRSYEIKGGVRITVGTRAQTRRLLEELEKIW
jgi:histidinol-phosphate aminotransferase